jgi:drug/metabolite transporter (DMT)-like permease
MNLRKKGLFLVLVTALISGFSIFINKLGVKGVDPYFYTFLKNFVAGTFLIAILFLFKSYKEIINLKKDEVIKLFLIGLVGGAIPFMLFFKGISLTSAVTAGFIHKTLFIYVGLMAAFFLKEKITKSMFLGFLSLIIGSFLFLNVKMHAFNVGDLYVFIAVLYWAIEIVISKKLLKKLSGTLVASSRLFIGSIIILFYLLITQKAYLFSSIDSGIFLWMVIGGVLLAGYNFTFYNGLKQLKAVEATAILTLGMPITGLLSIIFLDKTLNPLQFMGVGFMLLGVILINSLFKNNIQLNFKKLIKVQS